MTQSVSQHAPGDGDFAHAGVTAIRGRTDISNVSVAIVVARFNSAITDALFNGAVDVLTNAGLTASQIVAVQVPGAVELSVAAREFARAGAHAGIVALGCVIRGDTSHFDYVCSAATDGCMRVMLDYGIPIGFGLVTCDTLAQAQVRSQSDGGANVGADAASAALEMLGLIREINQMNS